MKNYELFDFSVVSCCGIVRRVRLSVHIRIFWFVEISVPVGKPSVGSHETRSVAEQLHGLSDGGAFSGLGGVEPAHLVGVTRAHGQNNIHIIGHLS